MRYMKKINLSVSQRIIAVIIYTIILFSLCVYFNGGWNFLDSNNYSLILISGALLLLFGTYIAEPFFTKPVDVITNSISVILALLSISNPSEFIGYYFLFFAAVFVLFLSTFLIFVPYQKKAKYNEIIFEIVVKIGQSKIIFSALYIFTIFSYFKDSPIEFIFLLTFWIIFISQFFVESTIIWISKILKISKNKNNVLGIAIGCKNPFLYQIEINDSNKANKIKKGSLVYIAPDGSINAVVGIVIEKIRLVDKEWIIVYLFSEGNKLLEINLKNKKFIYNAGTIFSDKNFAYYLDLEEVDIKEKNKIKANNLFKNRDNFIGYVYKGSNIDKIVFHILNSNRVEEGAILETDIGNKNCLYQVIDGKLEEEDTEKYGKYGYSLGIGKKLGRYNSSKKELNIVKWIPDIYSPIFKSEKGKSVDTRDVLSIGRLPDTNFEIPIKDINSLVTHNTAILGILGVGKSCLSFEIIEKLVSETNVKIICIDITNEYKEKLKIKEELISHDEEDAFNSINLNFNHIEYIKNSEGKQVPTYEKSGNQKDYRKELRKDLLNFIFKDSRIPKDKEFDKTNRIRIYNPEYHKVSKGEKMGYNVITRELTQAEKTRIICEEVFSILMTIGIKKDDKDARILLVFEEAHSLIPEWNSTANEGDSSAANGTAKIILQGRKYGLGSLVITQRTANISKSILNQCNTIFALRSFDDTSKNFLENYIGSDYSNALCLLDERQAIISGKSLRLKQPIIIELNEREEEN